MVYLNTVLDFLSSNQTFDIPEFKVWKDFGGFQISIF